MGHLHSLPKTYCPRCGDDLVLGNDEVLDLSMCQCGMLSTADELIDENTDYQWVE